MIMARPKMTEEQKMERKLAKKAEKQAQRDAEWNARQAVWAQQAAESREKVIATLDPEFKSKFEKAVAYAEKSNNEFFKDIANKWQRFGNLSLKQMQVLVNGTERDIRKAAVSEVIDEWYVVGEKSEIRKLEIRKVEEVVVGEGYFAGVTTKISMKNKAGIFFSVKTNAAKLIDVFKEALEKGLTVNLNAKVKWHFEDSDTVILTSRGMKVEINNG
jgi:hypothetical protein